MAGLLGRGVLAGAKLVNKGNPLWSILGRGRFNPLRGAREATYRGQPFPEGAATGTARTRTSGIPGGTTFRPIPGKEGAYRTTHGGTATGSTLPKNVLLDPKLYNPARTTGFLNPRAHPYRAGAVGAAATLGLPALWRGGEEEMPNISGTRMPPPEVSMQGLPSYSDRLFKQNELFFDMMQDAVTKSGIVAAIDEEEGENLLKNMKELISQTVTYKNDSQLAKIADAALKSTGSPSEIYHRMIKGGASPEEAMKVSGHQIKIKDATIGDLSAKERVWEGIVQVAMTGDITQAAQMLVQAWGTGLLGGAPMSENPEQRMEIALQYLTQYMQGDTGVAPGMGSGITDISVA